MELSVENHLTEYLLQHNFRIRVHKKGIIIIIIQK